MISAADSSEKKTLRTSERVTKFRELHHQKTAKNLQILAYSEMVADYDLGTPVTMISCLRAPL